MRELCARGGARMARPQAVGGDPEVVGGDPEVVGGDPEVVGGDPEVVGGAPTKQNAPTRFRIRALLESGVP